MHHLYVRSTDPCRRTPSAAHRTARRAVPTLLAALLATGCGAAATPGPEGSQPTRIVGDAVLVEQSAERTVGIVQADPETALRAAARAYEELGIPLEHIDRRSGVIGNRRVTLSRRLAGQPLSRYFDCGGSVSGAPAADSYRITAEITTGVEPADGGTRIETRVRATARDRGTSTDPVRCASRGRLEREILARISERLEEGGA